MSNTRPDYWGARHVRILIIGMIVGTQLLGLAYDIGGGAPAFIDNRPFCGLMHVVVAAIVLGFLYYKESQEGGL